MMIFRMEGTVMEDIYFTLTGTPVSLRKGIFRSRNACDVRKRTR